MITNFNFKLHWYFELQLSTLFYIIETSIIWTL